jgi:arylsulfatase A-like enzyme
MGYAGDNLAFEEATTPARWSMPSHASLFTGQYPHEHGLSTDRDTFDSVPLVASLNDSGYTTYGVSANPFAGPMTDFDAEFDHFTYTLLGYRQAGLDVRTTLQGLDGGDSMTGQVRKGMHLLTAALGHENPRSSIYNVGVQVVRTSVDRFDTLQRVPHPLFHESGVFSYSPTHNTERIESIIDSEAQTDEPWFVFSNYMDTHRPYYPSERFRSQVLESSVTYRDIERVNDTVGHPQRFLELAASGDVDDEDVELVRDLYAATVVEVDHHVDRLLTALEEAGMREETLVVVTADHGEDLGESTPWGRRMGHIDSVSENLLGVPLLLIHPDLDGEVVSERVSLKELFSVVSTVAETGTVSNDLLRSAMRSDGMVAAECPATSGDWRSDYPDVPRAVFERQTAANTVVCYRDDEKLVRTSTDDALAWRDREGVSPDSLPDGLQDCCADRLAALQAISGDTEPPAGELDETTVSQLEGLGYL